MLSPDQLEQRALGITATEITAILGVNPYRSALDVWLEKRGDREPFEGNVRTKWGNLLEPVIRADYEERHGVRVEVPGTIAHPDHPWWLATPDGLVYRNSVDPERGLEIKTHTIRMSHEYGAPGSDEVPAWELAQCMWCMGVTPGVQRWDLVAFIDGQPVEYVIDRDDELIGIMRERGERFLVDNVKGGAVPDPDGTEADSKALAKAWKKTTGNLIDIGDDLATFDLVEKARELRGSLADDEEALEKVGQALKLKIADADGLTWKNAKGKPEKITWKHSKPSRYVDFASIVGDMKGIASVAVQAKRPDIERALYALRSIPSDSVGRSTKAAITAGEIAEIIVTLQTTLTDVARCSTEEQRTRHYVNRPMFFPRGWKAPKEK